MSYPETEHRVIQLKGQVLRYKLVRRKRRTVGFKVDHDGLSVAAPLREPYTHLDQLLTESADWIIGKLDALAGQRLPARKWVNGEALPILGQTLDLYVFRTYTRSEPMRGGDRLFVGVPDPKQAELIRQRVAAWYRAQALRHFRERMLYFAQRLPVAVPVLKLSEAKSSWGICMPDGTIRLSWRLIKAPPEQVDYVVAHELAHLRHMDHSPRFWQTVGELYPEYRRERKALEENGHRYHTF